MNCSQLNEFYKCLTDITVVQYAEDNPEPTMIHGYEDATIDIMQDIQNIIFKTNSYETLKKELSDFILDRQAFLDFLNEKWDEQSDSYVFSVSSGPS